MARRAVIAALLLACSLPVAAARADDVQSGRAVRADVSPPLRSITPKTTGNGRGVPARGFGRTSDEIRLEPGDRGRQSQQVAAGAPTTGAAWDGVSNVNSVVPPDTNGDVGPHDYVQWVNLSFEVFSKTGASRLGPLAGNTLWSGFGGVCDTTNQGDPYVVYDRQADRWVLAQFAFKTKGGKEVAPYFECVAVSTTGDPTGSYYRYAFQVTGATGDFPDYPKLAVWPDGYYLTTNNFNGNTFAGAGVYALDRTKMLAGDPTAGFVGFQLASNYGGLLPADADGANPPPPGAAEYIGGVDTDSPNTGSTFQIWRLHPDFATPANTTISAPTQVPVTTYTHGFCNSTFSTPCVTQPGTSQRLDNLSDRLMNRLQYRNFGDHDTLVGSHTVNAGANQAGMRWYEIRDPGAPSPTVYQQSTYAPADGVNRWMGSVAMDGSGDIALGYSASGSSVFPSIRYTGRLAGDPLNTMTLGEQTMTAGAGSQTGYDRWGDYSSMNVDPVDDATFWYTQEYYAATSASGWRTRIGSFKLAPTPNVAISAPADGGAVNAAAPTFSGTADGDTSAVTVKVYAGTAAAGSPLQTLAATRDAGGNWSVPAVASLPDGTYTAQAEQTDSSARVGYSQLSTFRVDTVAPTVTLTSPADGSATTDSTPTVAGTASSATGDSSTVTVKVYSGSSATGSPVRTLTFTRGSGGAWSGSVSPALSDGTYTAQAVQGDSAGNTGQSATRTFTVDTTAPVVSESTPAAGAANDATPSFSGTASDPGTVTVSVYSGTSASGTPVRTLATTPAAGAWSVDASPALVDGTYTARAQQTDTVGNTGFGPAITFTVDTVAPVVTVTAPAAGAVTSDSTPALTGTAGSASGDSATVAVNIHSGSTVAGPVAQTLTVSRSGGTWSTTAAPALADGTYTIEAKQQDSAGNTGVSSGRTFTVDTAAPAVSLTSPSAGQMTGTTPAFGGVAGIAAGDSASVTVDVFSGSSVSGSPVQTRTAAVSPSDGSFTVSASPALALGTYTARARQSDSAGNTGTSTPVTFTAAPPNTPPVASFTFAPASPLVAQLVNFDGSGSSDPDGTVASWAWDFGDGATGAGATPSHAYALAGSYTAQLTVTDNRGGTATSAAQLTVTTPQQPPPAGQPPAQQPPAQQPAAPAPVAPHISLRVVRQRLTAVLARGLSAIVTSDQAGTATVKLVLSSRTAKRLGLPTTIASARKTVSAGTSQTVKLGLSRRARSKLAHARSLTATLRLSVTGSGGTTALAQRVTLSASSRS